MTTSNRSGPRHSSVPSQPFALGARLTASLLLLLGALACAAGPPGTSDVPATARETGEESPAAGDTVEVILDEYVIEMPGTLAAGPTIFRVTNEGREDHNFLMDRDGIRTGVEDALPPGETTHMRADLEPGRYTMICTWAGHDSRGMYEQVEVEAAGTPDDG